MPYSPFLPSISTSIAASRKSIVTLQEVEVEVVDVVKVRMGVRGGGDGGGKGEDGGLRWGWRWRWLR